jgi:type III secretion system low calcium response chaperone LcrH/SycD
MAITTPTAPGTPERLQQDTEALLRMICQGGTLAGLYQLSPHELEALYALGMNHYTQARYAEASKVFSRLVTLDHGEVRYYNALAAAHQMQGQHERAVHYWGVSQLLDASDPVPTFHTAQSLLALGLVQDALDALDIVVRQCPRRPGHEELAARAEALLTLVRSKSAAAIN